MTNERSRRLQKWFIGVSTTLLIGLLSAGGALLVDIRDNVKYKQPHYDMKQDEQIDEITIRCDDIEQINESQRELNGEILRQITEVSGDIKRLEQKQDYTIQLIGREGLYYTTYR